MDNLSIKYWTYAAAQAPRPVRTDVGGWSGTSVKMEDGSDPQPWHCMPFVEASTYGLELVYPYETECRVINDGGVVRFDWDYAREPGAEVTGGEFAFFSPVRASKYYLFNTRLDILPPAGHVVRTEPHPRFFTDDTGTVPCALIGHLQNEWYPRLTFVVFRAPRPGERHVFRKGEPFVQLIFVPAKRGYDLKLMDPEVAAQRRALEQAIQRNRLEIAENRWRHPDGAIFNNHYKLLARAFAREGMAGVHKLVNAAGRRHDAIMPGTMSLEESLARAAQFIDERKHELARDTFLQILQNHPDCADALSGLGICLACMGNLMAALDLMSRAVSLQPRTARFRTNLGELYRRSCQLPAAELSLRASLQLKPDDADVLGLLGLVLAQQGKVGDAMEAYRAATRSGRFVPASHVQMGLALAHFGHIEEARACYQAALAVAPNFPQALQALQDLPGNAIP